MSQESEIFHNLASRREQLIAIRTQREVLVQKIGSGGVRPGEIWENTLKVANVRKKVRTSIPKIQTTIDSIDYESEEMAPTYADLLKLRSEQLDQMQSFVSEGLLSDTDIAPHITEYNALRNVTNALPGLKKGLEKLNAEKDTEKQPQAEEEIEKPKISAIEVETKESPLRLTRLMPEIRQIISHHEHLENPDITVYSQLEIALKTEGSVVTPQQQQLIEDVLKIRQYVEDERYQKVYTPEELHALLIKFEKIKPGNRPDFDGFEAKILDIIDQVMQGERTESDKGFIRRSESDSLSRRGMNWGSMSDRAKHASQIIRLRDSAGRLSHYLIGVSNPYVRQNREIEPILQFVADSNAQDILANRSTRVTRVNRESFIQNCVTIDEWYKAVEPIILRISEVHANAVSKSIRDLKNMIDNMHERLNGNTMQGYGKSYKLNTEGAIKLQLRIAHSVDDLNLFLNKLEQQTPTSQDETEIVPLD